MKKIISFAAAAAMSMALCAVASDINVARADNPAIQTIYSTDPAPMVYDDTVYLYTGRDKDNSDFYYMPDWHCYSSKDMQNWTDHGMILSWDSFTWGKEDSAWAAQCIERNGKFYYYVTLEHKSGGGRAIGVAVADSPTGPFKDALGKPLVGPNWDYIDPTVFIDDDGQAWLMFGNPTCYYVKLNEDMTSYSGSVGKFDMNSQSFGPSSNKASSYGEGPWFYKRNDKYYLVFAAFYGSDGGESLGWSTAPSPTGPWTYGGQVMKPHNCFTNHPGVIDFKGHSYLFYHDASLPGGGSFDRSVCIDEFQYGADGSIPTISPTKEGPKQLQTLDPYQRVEAETICFSNGVKTEKCDKGGMNIGNIKNGSYIKVKGVDFGSGTDKFTASVSSNSDGGNIEIYLDSLTGKKIGTLKVGSTGGWQSWKELSCDISGASGEHDLFFKFTGGSDYLLNMDWWCFGDGENTAAVTTTTKAAVTTTATSKKSDATTAAKTTTTAAKHSSDTGDYIFDYSFESGDEGWEGRAGASIETSSKSAFTGSKSLFCSGRSEAYQGAAVAAGSLKAGEAYSLSANVMYDSGKDSDTFHFTMQYDIGDETNYAKIATAQPMKGKWVQLANTSFKVPDGAENVMIYVETDKSTVDFYVDDVKAAKAGTVIKGAEGGQFILGDVNSDGSINAFDILKARKLLLSNSKDADLEKLADVDKSTKFETNDLILIQNYVLGKITEFPDNSPEPVKSDFDYNPNLQYRAAPDSYFRQPANHGTVVKENYDGINGNKNMYVYLPYGYDESKKYNVFYLMHGGGESEETCFNDNDINIDVMLDNMIANGDIEPMIVVTPTFNKAPSADGVWEEMRKSIIPYVESKYSTYAESTTIDGLRESRFHRAYGGFSMGGGSTWANFNNNLDIIAYFMPLSGHCWDGAGKVCNAARNSGFKQNEYFVLAATGTDDLAYGNMVPMINELKKNTDVFTYSSDFSKGNLYFLEARGNVHWWPQVRHYIYDALPYFFHENQ